jgi:RNA polymerase sigma-70 factor (ECF subfamily)
LQLTEKDATAQQTKVAVEPEIKFAELFQQFHPRVYNYLRYRVNVTEDADDLVSTVFEKAFVNREQFDPAKGNFSAWIFRIAHNTLANYYRTRERRARWESERLPAEDLRTPETPLESQVIQQESILQLLQGLDQLKERDQEVISLKFAGRLSNKEIGDIMDLKEKTVSVVLLRAMRRLQQIVKGGAA